MAMHRAFNVDVMPGGFPPLIKVNQYDAGVIVYNVNVTEGEIEAQFETGTTAYIAGTKPSGLGFNVQCMLSGNSVTVPITATMTEEAGRFPVELVFMNGNTRVGTANIEMMVEPSPHPAGTTDGDIESAKTLVEQMQASVTEAQGYATTAAESAAGVAQAVTEAQGYATTAAESAAGVAQAVTEAQGYAAAAAEGAAEAAVEVVTVTGARVTAETGKRYIFDGSTADLTIVLGAADKIFDLIVTAASSGLDLWIDGLGETLSFPPGLTVTEEEGIYGVTLPGGYTYEINIMSGLVLLEAWT